jgi:acyl-coenzyme A synthetase/AMP-(fatty) acid ligase/aryl carrier-like protein
MINGYGPSETTIGATAAVNWDLTKKPPLGRPLAGVTCYVLDATRQPVPEGFPGELFIGGIGVARGYLGEPELSSERFLPDPFSVKPGARLYRTGDLARWLPAGNIDFLGRVDQQVKIRGFRVELGEIENVLVSHPGVRHCVVDVRTEGNGMLRLAGYYVASDPEASPSPSDLRLHLQSRLPDYMVPHLFVRLPEIPLTVNGKLNRAALPAPAEAMDNREAYVAPRTEIEARLCGVWASLLGLEKVGVNDNFFEIGGDSILSIQMLARANREGIELTPRDLFQHQTIGELAQLVGAATVATNT